KMALRTSRRSVLRGRPPGRGAGISGSNTAQWVSVMSVGYGGRFIFHYTQLTPFGTDSESLETDHEVRDADLRLILQGVEVVPACEVVTTLDLPDQPGGHQQSRLVAVHGTADLRGVLPGGQLLVEPVGPFVVDRPVQDLDHQVGIATVA